MLGGARPFPTTQLAQSPTDCVAHCSPTMCRLPSDPGKRNGVQFATGLLLKDGSLYISYGITDCYSALARVEDIGIKLPLWEERGLGTQRALQ